MHRKEDPAISRWSRETATLSALRKPPSVVDDRDDDPDLLQLRGSGRDLGKFGSHADIL